MTEQRAEDQAAMAPIRRLPSRESPRPSRCPISRSARCWRRALADTARRSARSIAAGGPRLPPLAQEQHGVEAGRKECLSFCTVMRGRVAHVAPGCGSGRHLRPSPDHPRLSGRTVRRLRRRPSCRTSSRARLRRALDRVCGIVTATLETSRNAQGVVDPGVRRSAPGRTAFPAASPVAGP